MPFQRHTVPGIGNGLIVSLFIVVSFCRGSSSPALVTLLDPSVLDRGGSHDRTRPAPPRAFRALGAVERGANAPAGRASTRCPRSSPRQQRLESRRVWSSSGCLLGGVGHTVNVLRSRAARTSSRAARFKRPSRARRSSPRGPASFRPPPQCTTSTPAGTSIRSASSRTSKVDFSSSAGVIARSRTNSPRSPSGPTR